MKIRTVGLFKYEISNLLHPGKSDFIHSLEAECPYCKHTLKIILRDCSMVAKRDYDEACRLTLLHHLRTEHPKFKKSPTV